MKAAILAGGLGKRLRPLTDDKPKIMVEVLGKPIVAWQVEWLKSYGVKEIILCTGFRKGIVIDYVGSGAKFGVKVGYSVEEEQLGTGGAIKNAEPFFAYDGKFIVVNGDIITDLNPLELESAMGKDAIGAMALVPLRSPYGIVESMGDGMVTGFREKPLLGNYWINAGVYCLKTSMFAHLPDKGNIETETLPKLAEQGALMAVKFADAMWRSIDTHKDIEEAERELKERHP